MWFARRREDVKRIWFARRRGGAEKKK